MRDYELELKNRVKFIRDILENSGTKGIIFGNSGGKDSALVGIICKRACDNVLGVIMPCESIQNYGKDTSDGLEFAQKFGIKTITVDLTEAKATILNQIKSVSDVTDSANINIAPRLRMTTLYAIGQSKNYIVAGTGNRSETYMGYFTKWGDGACDFNPIADLTVTEVYEFLRYLDAPESIINKAPSAGLFEGQTDEAEMGVSYSDIDNFLLYGIEKEEVMPKIESMHNRSEHKRVPIVKYIG